MKSIEKLGGDVVEFGKKRNKDHDFPSPLYVGENKNNIWVRIRMLF